MKTFFSRISTWFENAGQTSRTPDLQAVLRPAIQRDLPVTDLLERRIVALDRAIDDETAAQVIARLFFLESRESDTPVQLWVNSPGGATAAGLALIDAMKDLSAPVYTHGYGTVDSMAAIIVACGEKRFAESDAVFSLSRAWIYSPGRKTGKLKKVNGPMGEELDLLNENLCKILSEATGKSLGQIEEILDENPLLTARCAQEYGLIDEIRNLPVDATG